MFVYHIHCLLFLFTLVTTSFYYIPISIYSKLFLQTTVRYHHIRLRASPIYKAVFVIHYLQLAQW